MSIVYQIYGNIVSKAEMEEKLKDVNPSENDHTAVKIMIDAVSSTPDPITGQHIDVTVMIESNYVKYLQTTVDIYYADYVSMNDEHKQALRESLNELIVAEYEKTGVLHAIAPACELKNIMEQAIKDGFGFKLPGRN